MHFSVTQLVYKFHPPQLPPWVLKVHFQLLKKPLWPIWRGKEVEIEKKLSDLFCAPQHSLSIRLPQIFKFLKNGGARAEKLKILVGGPSPL